MDRVIRLKTILWTLTGLGAAVGLARFLWGLGATTHLSDATPWGLWIGFDVMSGVALAAGGFIITATVYIFKLEKFHGIVRPAVLTAFLGYIAVAVGLLFDLGLPWNIWHMIVFWNPHSALFEVGWCVMLYLAVLSLEFFPVPAEEFSFLAGIRRVLIKFRLPLVIVGIALSTLHQSSLGSLFLIMPNRVHPLWYSPLLPVLFFVSAIGLGLMMVTFESLFTAYHYRRKPETELLGKLGAAARWVFILYLLLRFADLAVRGQLSHLTGSEWQVKLFWFEILVMAVIPIVLLFIPKVCHSNSGQWVVAIMGVFGVVLNRIDVGGLIHINRGSNFYLPSWTEIAISAAVVSAAALAFLFMVEHFKVWEERPADPEADPLKLPEFNPVADTWLGVPVAAARTRYSLAFILAMAVGFAFLSGEPAGSRGLDPTPTHAARGGNILWIDGNLDGYGVSFPHVIHMQLLAAENSCAACHHMNLPGDQHSQCVACHRDMYLLTDAFGHDFHSSPDGANLSCRQCHKTDAAKNAESVIKTCDDCHGDLTAPGSTIPVDNYQAPSYADAMHRMCIGCHAQKAEEYQDPDFARCAKCHAEPRSLVNLDRPQKDGRPVSKRVVLPLKPQCRARRDKE